MPKKTHRRKHQRVLARQTRFGVPPERFIAEPASPERLIAEPAAPPSLVQVLAYGAANFTEQAAENPQQVRSYLYDWPVTWVNVNGLGDGAVIKELGDIFGLHWLALEDVLRTDQRAKVEQYGEDCFIVARMSRMHERVETEQISILLGQQFVLTFQESPGDCLEPVRERLRKGQRQLRHATADYLVYAILDAIIDNYFPVLEQYGERLEILEDDLIANPTTDAIAQIHDIKRDLLLLRRAIWPQREALGALLRNDMQLLTPETRLHLRDCYDQSVQLIDFVETYRQLCADLTDMYLSSLSNRTNEIMRVLTGIATIFIPLTFIVGVYGMNFNSERSPWNMPELNWYWGYPFCLALMTLIAFSQLVVFWRRGWIGLPKVLWRRAEIENEPTVHRSFFKT